MIRKVGRFVKRHSFYIAFLAVVGAVIAIRFWIETSNKQTEETRVHLLWPLGLRDDTKVEIRVLKQDGTLIHESNKPIREGLHFQLQEDLSRTDLSVQMKTPEGWTNCKYKQEQSQYPGVYLRLAAGIVYLWIDNMDGKTTAVSCGVFQFPILAKSKKKCSFPTPLTKDIPLILGTEQVGSISRYDNEAVLNGSIGYLLDCSQNKSYQFQRIVYEGKKGMEDPRIVRSNGWKVVFSKQHLHKLPRSEIDFFLTPAPESINIQTYGPQFFKQREPKYQLLAIE